MSAQCQDVYVYCAHESSKTPHGADYLAALPRVGSVCRAPSPRRRAPGGGASSAGEAAGGPAVNPLQRAQAENAFNGSGPPAARREP